MSRDSQLRAGTEGDLACSQQQVTNWSACWAVSSLCAGPWTAVNCEGHTCCAGGGGGEGALDFF